MQTVDDLNKDDQLSKYPMVTNDFETDLENENDLDIEIKNIEEINIDVNNLSNPIEIYDDRISKVKNGKLIYILIGGLLGVIILSFLGTFYYVNNTIKNWENYVYPGVHINGNEVSMMTKDQLTNNLKEEYLNPVTQKSIIVKTPDKDYRLDFSALNPQYNIDEVAEEAFSFKKDDTLINKYLQITNILSKGEKKELSLKYSFNDKAILSFADGIASEFIIYPVDATFRLENGIPYVTDDIKGTIINKDELISMLKEIASNPNATDLSIEAPLDTYSANVTGDLLRRINGVISTFTTSDTNPVRLVNMDIAARDLNGTMVLPGETFSFNDRVGDSTPDKGYVLSYSFIDGKSVPDYGGGVCQVSTTLYGTLLRANIMPIERGPHIMPIWYVPKGLDAAVFYGVLDIKFINTYDAPIYIESFLNGESLTITFYGDTNLMNGLRYEPYSVLISDLVADAYLDTIDSDGNVINTDYLHRDTYN